MQKFFNKSLRLKLLYSFLLIAGGTVLTGGVQFYYLATMSEKARVVAEVNLVNTGNLAKMDSALKTISLHLTKLTATSLTPGALEEEGLYLNEAAADFEKFLSMYASIVLQPEAQKLAADLTAAYSGPKKEITDFTEAVAKSPAEELKRLSENHELLPGKNLDPVSDLLNKLLVSENESGFKLSQEIKGQSALAKIVSSAAMSGFLILSIWLALFLSKIITRELAAAASSAALSAASLDKASRDMFDSSQRLATGVEQQSATLQTSVSALTEISAMIEKISDESGKSLAQAKEGESMADEGRASVQEISSELQEIFTSMRGLLGEVENNNQKTAEILETLRLVTAKTKMIDEIVFQTKLLSFNASVEAARAGEFGKGFAVVAEEVGNLAKLSGTAALEINEILTQSFGRVEGILKESSGSVKKWNELASRSMDSGVSKSKHATDVLGKIHNVATAITGRAGDINVAIQEQKRGLTEIEATIQEMDRITAVAAKAAHQNKDIATQIGQESKKSLRSVEALESLVKGDAAKKKESSLAVLEPVSHETGRKAA